MKRILHEPLLHFVLLGAALFGLHAALGGGAEEAAPGDIVVDARQINLLALSFANAWQRPPTPDELKGLIDQHIKEELLSREAIKLGLDQNDTIIRRRLGQKLEFLSEDIVTSAEPTDAELADYLARNPDAFRQEQRLTFRHIFLNPQKRGERLDADAAAMLVALKQHDSSVAPRDLGDSTLLPDELTDEPQRGIEAQFGKDFSDSLAKLKPGQWSGPIPSAYGAHLVLITGKSEGRQPALDEVREQVKREWVNARRLDANQKFLDGLLAKYRVTIEWPTTPGATGPPQRLGEIEQVR